MQAPGEPGASLWQLARSCWKNDCPTIHQQHHWLQVSDHFRNTLTEPNRVEHTEGSINTVTCSHGETSKWGSARMLTYSRKARGTNQPTLSPFLFLKNVGYPKKTDMFASLTATPDSGLPPPHHVCLGPPSSCHCLQPVLTLFHPAAGFPWSFSPPPCAPQVSTAQPPWAQCVSWGKEGLIRSILQDSITLKHLSPWVEGSVCVPVSFMIQQKASELNLNTRAR